MKSPKGGTELALAELQSRMSDEFKDKINVITSVCNENLIIKNKINVIWQQLSYDQEAIRGIINPSFINQVDLFVFVSHWQYEKFKKMFDVPSHKSVILHNATKIFPHHEKPKNQKLKLIYTSMPNRGLYSLLGALDYLDTDKFDVDIYSSTIIYGSEYDKMNRKSYEYIWDKAKHHKNVYLKGYATNDEIRSALTKSHIMAYPCTFEETSCMSAIEALSAGCKIICSNYGALPETVGIWGDMITFDEKNNEIFVKRFRKLIEKTVNMYWDHEVQEKLKDQTEHYKKYWSWDFRYKQWEQLFNRLLEIKNAKR